MDFKKILLVFFLIICVLFLVSSVAAGNVNDEVMASESQDSVVVSQATVEVDNDNQIIENNLISSSSEDILSEKDNGTFTALQDKISNAAEGATIELENDYANDGVLADGILISKSITINGNGYTIDAQHKSRIFNVTANNVVLNDIKFINGNATSGGAIHNIGNNLNVTNCVFEKNSAVYGGAIFSEGDNVTIWNSTFINNAADWGGANYFKKKISHLIIAGDFINNVAQISGGANYFNDKVANVSISGDFSDNVAANGSGAANYFFKSVTDVYIVGDYLRNIANSNCNGSDKTGSGGANCFNKTADNVIILGDYSDNVGYRGGANFFYGAASNISIAGDYDNNTGRLFGGANYFMNTLTDSTIDGKYSNNKATNWGGASYINKFAKNVIISGDYIENSAVEGAAIFFDRKMENVTTLINLIDNKGKSTIYMAYRIDSTLTVEDMEFDYNTTGSTEFSFTDALSIEATVVNQPDAVVNVNNNTITVSGLEPGTYILSVKTVTDDEHDSVTKEAKITVNKLKTQLSVSTVTTTYNVNKNLVVTLKDANGNPLSDVYVIVNLNGAKTYETDENGQIKVSTKGLAPKAYTAKITFNGNAKYNQATKSVKVTVKKATPKLTAKAKTFKQSVKTKKYSVTLKTNLNKAIKNAKVTLKVNKKTYTAKTNKKGVAIFKITKLTKKGTFKATITYKGDAYYNKVTKKVNIKCV